MYISILEQTVSNQDDAWGLRDSSSSSNCFEPVECFDQRVPPFRAVPGGQTCALTSPKTNLERTCIFQQIHVRPLSASRRQR